MNLHRQCLYDPEWQALRVSLLSKWCRDSTVHEALDALERYLTRSPTNELRTRAWRILNLLNAILMGYNGQGIPANDVRRDAVRSYRDYVRWYKDTYREQELVVLDEHQVAEKWLDIPLEVRNKVQADLVKRRLLHRYSQFRPELDWFLGIISRAETKVRVMQAITFDVIKTIVMEGKALPGPKILINRDYFDELDLPLWIEIEGVQFNLLVEFRNDKELQGSAYRIV